MKECKKCGVVKPLDEFYPEKWSSDGYSSTCRECKRAYQRNRPKETIAEIERRRNQKPERKKFAYANLCRWRKENPEKVAAQQARYPERQKARGIVARAVRAGKLVKELCSCGSDKVHAHHEDYSKPLEVEWLCAKCHRERHEQKG